MKTAFDQCFLPGCVFGSMLAGSMLAARAGLRGHGERRTFKTRSADILEFAAE
jgi:hypothetical protein